MNRARYEDVPVKKTDEGIDVTVPLATANELGFMRLARGPVEFGTGKNRVMLHLDENETPAENRK
jgi:hypothetical protein